MAELRDPHWPRQVPDGVASEVVKPRTLWQPVFHQLFCGGRQYGLAAVRQIAQAGCLVDRRARIVAFIAQLHFTGVQADAQLDRRQRRSL